MSSFAAHAPRKRQPDIAAEPDNAVKRQRQADVGDAVAMADSALSAPTTANAPEPGQPTHAEDIYIRQAAPAFASVPAVLPGEHRGTVSLSDFAGQYLVIVFYSGDFNLENAATIAQYSEHIDSFRQMGCSVLVCSTDSEYAHGGWQKQARINGGIGPIALPMLADRTRQVSCSFGVLCPHSGQAQNSIFIIDPSQNIRVAMVDENAAKFSVNDVLQLVSALHSCPR